MTQRRIEYLPLDEVVPAERNPRRHDLAAVRTSIDRFGFASPALRDERTGRLVVGHGRCEALRQMRDQGQSPPAGLQADEHDRWLVPVVCGWASRSDAEAEAYLVADNHHATLAGWDQGELVDILTAVKADDPSLLQAAGYSPEDLDDLVHASRPPDLDELAAAVGEPKEADGWPTIKIKVPHHLSTAWQAHLDTHSGDVPAAFAALLGLDATAPESSG